MRHDDHRCLYLHITEQHLCRGPLEANDHIRLHLTQHRRHILLDVFRKKFIVDTSPISLSECTQHLALDLERRWKCMMLSTKMLEIVCRDTLVEWIKKSSLAVVCIDGRHHMATSHHLVRKRGIHLRRSARISDHL